jgi:serine/threonine protein kinase
MLKKQTVLSTAYDKYKVEKQIGQGGNGVVYKVVNLDGEVFAVKTIDRANTTKDKLKRFKNEMSFCEKHSHPNIIKVLDNGAYEYQGDDLIFFVMPYYSMTLRDKCKIGNWTPNEKIDVFLQLLNALKYAHDKKIYHRDVKPENVLIGNDGEAVLADFGIAHFAAEELVTAVETKMSDRLANFQYSAPEQRQRNGTVSGAADVYAAGLILNEMFTGKVIGGSSYAKIADSIAEWGYLDALVEMMIAQDPNQRLFPVAKVIFQLEVLDREQKTKAEISKLTTMLPDTQDYTPFEAPNAIDANYTSSKLTILLDKSMPRDWASILQSGNYSHSSLMSYPTAKYSQQSGNEFVVNVPPSDEGSIPDIIKKFRSWIPTVNDLYNNEMKRRHESQIREQEQRKQNEIKQAQAALRINQSLQDLFN